MFPIITHSPTMAADPGEDFEGVGTSPKTLGTGYEDGLQDTRDAVWNSSRKKHSSVAAETSFNTSAFSYGSLEAVGGEELSTSFLLLDQLEELRFQNRKLQEMAATLRTQLEAAEESRAEVALKFEVAGEKIRSLTHKNCALKEDNVILRRDIANLEDGNLAWQAKFSELEKKKLSLQSAIHLLENEDRDNIILIEKVHFLEQEVDKVQSELQIKSTQLSDFKKQGCELKEQLQEINKNYEELHKNHSELKTAYQALRVEKSDVEEELSVMQQKMSKGTVLSRLVIPEITEEEFPQFQSTPNEVCNLHNELRVFVSESHLPSPICGPVSFKIGDKSELMEKLSSITDGLVLEVEKVVTIQRDEALPADKEFLGQTVEDIRSQVDSLLCNVKWIAQAKNNSDERAVKMGEKIRVLGAENASLRAANKMTTTTLSDSDSLDQRLSQACNELDLARAEVEIMEFTSRRDQQRMADMENMLTLLQEDLDIKSSQLESQSKRFEEQSELRRQAEEKLEETLSMLECTQDKLEQARLPGVPNETSAAWSLMHLNKQPSLSEEPSQEAGNSQELADQPDEEKTSLAGLNRDVEEFVKELRLANEQFAPLNDISSEEDITETDITEPLLESGYRTETSFTRSPLPRKTGPTIVTSPCPQQLSAIIDALALDVFPKPFQPSLCTPTTSSPIHFKSFPAVCSLCNHRFNNSRSDLVLPSTQEEVFPLLSDILHSINGALTDQKDSSDPKDSTTWPKLDRNKQTLPRSKSLEFFSEKILQDSCAQTDSVEVERDSKGLQICISSLEQERVATYHACTQTSGEFKEVFVEEGTLDQSQERSKVTKESQCDPPLTCHKEVLAQVPVTESQTQTDNAVSKEASHDANALNSHSDSTVNASVSVVENISNQTTVPGRQSTVEIADIGTQTLPNPCAACSCNSCDISIPVPPAKDANAPRPAPQSSPISSTLSTNFPALLSLPPHIVAEDVDSDFSSDSPAFVSARSSPSFLKSAPDPSDISKVIERLTFKPINPSRESMERTIHVSLDENSNREDPAEFRRQKSLPDGLVHQGKSPMRQRRSLERDRKYSGVIQDSNGQSVDLTTADIDVSVITPSDQKLSEKLLAQSRKISDKFQNRRGRRFSPDQREGESEMKQDESTSDSSPEPLKDEPSPRLMSEEERVGAEGDSDPEEEKKTRRKDSDEIDIKADIIKATGPINGDESPTLGLAGSKLKQGKKHKRTSVKFPMPELCEEIHEDVKLPSMKSRTLRKLSESASDTCKVEATSECSIQSEGEVKWEGKEAEAKQRKSSILSDSLLRTLGLKKSEGGKPATLSEQEVEEKYNSLTFAFKTDRLTLDERYRLQKHQRNVIEENLQDELREHTVVMKSLERRYAEDEIAKTDINKLKQHIDVLQYALVRLASKAEGYGAVQQEDRLSRAAEVMMTHVENVKRQLERDRAELAEAKRLLHENKIITRGSPLSGDAPDLGSRLKRSSTITSPTVKTGRRRASVAAVLGFGSQSSSHSRNHARAQSVPTTLSTNTLPLVQKNERGRFAALASAAMDRYSLSGSSLSSRGVLETCKEGEASRKSEDGDSPRTGDIRKKKLSISISSPNIAAEAAPVSPLKSLTPPPSMTFAKPLTPVAASSPNSRVPPLVVSGESGEGKSKGERSQVEEDIYQQGFEQGVRSQIAQELSELRDQQRALCDNLDDIMAEAEEEEEEEISKKKEPKPVLKWMREYSRNLPWSKTTQFFRLLVTGMLFILALISIIGTVIPLEKCQGGASVLAAPWEGVKRLLEPHIGLYHPRPPPT